MLKDKPRPSEEMCSSKDPFMRQHARLDNSQRVQVHQPTVLTGHRHPTSGHSSGNPNWCLSTHQDRPHLTENQEGSQLNVFTVPVLQRNGPKSCSRTEKQRKGRQLMSDCQILAFLGYPGITRPAQGGKPVPHAGG